jgi:hypothetical protein
MKTSSEYTQHLPAALEEVLEQVQASTEGAGPRPRFTPEQLFGENSTAAADLRETGVTTVRDRTGGEQLVAAELDENGFVMSMAAAIPTKGVRNDDFLKSLASYDPGTTPRRERLALLNKIYRLEPLANNAVNKSAALVAPDGSYVVRGVRGRRGKRQGGPKDELLTLLRWWTENVNASALDAVVTGARGVEAIITQGTRQALVEGDSVMRTQWRKVKVQALDNREFELPINIQFFSSADIEIPPELAGIGLETMYWVPPRDFVQRMQKMKDPELKRDIETLMGREVLESLKKTGKYRLSSELMGHIRHRGMGFETFGESLLDPITEDVRYKRALLLLDMRTIESLLSRVVILKVGSDDPKSAYHKLETSSRRLQLLQKMFQGVSHTGTILWGGPDLDVLEVSSHNKIMELDGRFEAAERRIRQGLGRPAALLTGEASDGKAAGWASVLGAAAELREVQSQWAQFLRTMGERIAMRNGFDDADVAWQWDGNLLTDELESANVTFKSYETGLISPQTALKDLGKDPESEVALQKEAVEKGLKEEVFGPPRSRTTTNPTGAGGETGGRPPSAERNTVERDPRERRERRTTEENR